MRPFTAEGDLIGLGADSGDQPAAGGERCVRGEALQRPPPVPRGGQPRHLPPLDGEPPPRHLRGWFDRGVELPGMLTSTSPMHACFPLFICGVLAEL